MPFKSSKQRRFLYANKPAVAKKFASHSKGGVSSKKSKKKG
jgi:hypothetical protein